MVEILCLKSIVCLSLKVVSARLIEFFISSLTASVTIVLYISSGVKHPLFRGQFPLFQQLHPNDAALGFKMFLL